MSLDGSEIQSELDPISVLQENAEMKLAAIAANPPDAIVITSGSIVEIVMEEDEASGQRSTRIIQGPNNIFDFDHTTPTDGKKVVSTRYTTTSFLEEKDENGNVIRARKDARGLMAAGKPRVLAAAQIVEALHENNHDRLPTIIATSTSTNNFSGHSDAEVSIEELKRQTSDLISDLDIHLEKDSIDTFSELLVSLKAGIEQNSSRMIILTTAFQQPRMQAMLDSLLHLDNQDNLDQIELMLRFNDWRIDNKISKLSSEEKTRLKQSYRRAYDIIRSSSFLPEAEVVAAEDILPARSAHHAQIIKALHEDPGYQQKIQEDKDATAKWCIREPSGAMTYPEEKYFPLKYSLQNQPSE